MLGEDTFQTINSPVAAGRQRASGLRFADPRVHSLLHALILFRQLAEGFRSADLRHHLAATVRPRSRNDLPRRHHLSTAPPAPARLDRAPPQQLPLSRDRIRLPRSPVLHPDLQPPPAARLGRRTSCAAQPSMPRSRAPSTNRPTDRRMDRSSPTRPKKLDTFAPCSSLKQS